MPSKNFISSALLALAGLGAVIAVPTPEKSTEHGEEVIPGPGLPSLASLGLTSEMLYAMPIPEELSNKNLEARFDPLCGPSDRAYTNVNDVIACYHYLRSLGTTPCTVPANRGVIEMCRSGDAHVSGQAITNNVESSWCQHVSDAVLWVVDHCTRADQSVAGFQAPTGNGNMVVGATVWYW